MQMLVTVKYIRFTISQSFTLFYTIPLKNYTKIKDPFILEDPFSIFRKHIVTNLFEQNFERTALGWKFCETYS